MLNAPVNHAERVRTYPYDVETMGDRVKSLRQARGLTQEQLAKACGVTKSAVSQWESGTTSNIKLPTVLALVSALKTDLAYLVYGADRQLSADVGGHRRDKVQR